ncbi:phosphate regulon sensor histidine kinase PhoR [Marinospirillum alkaliphilum]|uniref:Phosphate regulon sensor protein PhoR n=1 Tax=Marinospirillum alkaliphilum DSM 21637 TaxID=1122209 RepID=A0A1K1WKM4_9GAMM|nr:phosphate regulon sensor histidine kinase PhoR [Marinospirillum alkaliphilum]SFX37870.1 two-component system, OmpR family, phosphate regulon sensor histidine kinase PhoR [Marinospirillum alkaliphilum DSM 21637]
MKQLVHRELRRLLLLLVIGALLGWVAGYGWVGVLSGALSGCLVYALLNIHQLWRLQRWLQQPQSEPPEAKGLWGEVFDALYHYQRQQLRSQLRLKQTLDRIQESSQALRDGVVMIDSKGDLEWWNKAAEGLIGLRHPGDRGHPITHLLREPRFVEYFEQQRYAEPLILPSPIAEGRTLEYQVTLFGENERLLLIRDFTRMQRLERMRQDFIANVSHELRTPLTVLSGYLETFSDHADNLPSKWQRGLLLMRQQSTRMEHLVEDLLTLSRLETSDFEAEAEPIDVVTLLRSIRTDALALSGELHRVQLDLDPHLQIYGSEKELRSAFSNLVFNAVKYTPAGTEIQLHWFHDRAGAHLEVKDNGPGIDPAHLPRLTERFYRVDQGRSSSTGGTGLGLAIVKHVMLRHQGKLDIRSRQGEGSSFTCHFPLSKVYLSTDQ